jgi:hypothetical protein
MYKNVTKKHIIVIMKIWRFFVMMIVKYGRNLLMMQHWVKFSFVKDFYYAIKCLTPSSILKIGVMIEMLCDYLHYLFMYMLV